VPEGRPWFWTITSPDIPPSLDKRGYSATRDEDMAEFKAALIQISFEKQSDHCIKNEHRDCGHPGVTHIETGRPRTSSGILHELDISFVWLIIEHALQIFAKSPTD